VTQGDGQSAAGVSGAATGANGQPSLFVITAAGTTIRVDPQTGLGAGTFTVSNTTERPLRGRARLVPAEGAPEGWARVDEPERDFPARGTQQFALAVTVPPGTTGAFKYQPFVAWVESTDDFSYSGPTFTVEAATPSPPKRPFPWWLVVIPIVLLLIAGGVGGGVWWQGEQERAREAEAAAAATATAAAMDAAARATATAQAGVVARIARYTGTWAKSESSQVGLTTLVIARDGTTINLTARSNVRDVAGSGGVAQAICLGGGECSSASRSFAYSGDPLSVALEFTPQIVHQLTITVTPDGALASAVDQVAYRGATVSTTTYAFRRTRSVVGPAGGLDAVLEPLRRAVTERSP
jgi:hypothetical protein